MSGIVYLAQLSQVCRAELPELCTDASCENPQHDTDDLEPLDLTEAQEQAVVIEFDTRARRREDNDG